MLPLFDFMYLSETCFAKSSTILFNYQNSGIGLIGLKLISFISVFVKLKVLPYNNWLGVRHGSVLVD